jgi:hypothetical protein
MTSLVLKSVLCLVAVECLVTTDCWFFSLVPLMCSVILAEM